MAKSPYESLVHRSLRGISDTGSIIQYSRRWLWIGVTLALLLMGIGLTLLYFVGNETRNLVMKQLVAARESNAASLRFWLALQKKTVQSTTQLPLVQVGTVNLIEQFTSPNFNFHQVVESAEYRSLGEAITLSLGGSESLGWVLQMPNGTVLASSEMSLAGRANFPIPQTVKEKALSGMATVSTAFRSPVALNDLRSGSPVMAAVAPIMSEQSQCVGMLAMLLDPAKEFSSVMEVSQSGFSGETYAVDRDGKMISRSRFESQLRGIGLLPKDPSVSSILEISLHDPGINLLEERPPLSTESKPSLNAMASDLLRGGAGENSEGYRDYRGVPVFGAWCWLGDYDLGVATEIDQNEALSPVLVLRRLFFAFSGITMAALVGLIVLAYFASRFKRQAEASERIAHRMGQYVLLSAIGSGGMGNVYRGRHSLLRRPVAIKVLRTGLEHDPRAKKRFEREAQLTSQLTSPHTVALYDYGCTSQGEFFYVMEYLEGIDLAKLVEQFGPLPPGRAIHFLRQVCESLAEAHSVGVVHRDVKPANILLTSRGRTYDFLKLVDFGLGKREEAQSDMLTRTGALAGTPMYMSPEAVNNHTHVTAVSDIYSLGAVAYWLVAGSPIFEVGTPMEVCLRQVGQQPIPPSQLGREVPADLEKLILRCLAKNPQDRPQSADELMAELNRCQDANSWSQANAIAWWKEVYLPNQVNETVVGKIDGETFNFADDRLETNIDLDKSRIEE